MFLKFQNFLNWKFPYYTGVSNLENEYLLEIFIRNNLSLKLLSEGLVI